MVDQQPGENPEEGGKQPGPQEEKKQAPQERVGEKEIEELRKKSHEQKDKAKWNIPFLGKLKRFQLKGVDTKKLAVAALIIGIFFLGYWVRVIPGRFNELPGLDEFYFYRLGEYALSHNLQLPELDLLRHHPFGVNPYKSEFVLPIYLPVAMYLIFSALGLVGHWLTFVIIYPPLMGAFASVALFFLGREIYDYRAGLISAFFLATEPAYITRTVAGVIEKEAAIAPFAVLAVFFLIRGFRRKSLVSGVLGGICLAAIGMSSALAQYFYAIFAIFALLLLLLNYRIDGLVRSYLPAVLIGLFLPPFFVQHSTSIASFEGLPTIYFSVFITSLVFIRFLVERLKLVKQEQLKYVSPGIVVVLFVGFLLSSLFLDAPASVIASGSTLLSLQQTSAIGFTVAENQPGSWGNMQESVSAGLSSNILPQLSPLSPYLTIWLFMGIGILVMAYKILFALYKLFFKKGEPAGKDLLLVFFIIWIASSMWSVFYQIRLLFLFGPPAALLGGYALGFLVNNVLKLKASRREHLQAVTKYLPFYLIIFFALLAAVNIANAYVYTANQGSSICFADPRVLIDGQKCIEIVDGKEKLAEGQPWYQAFTFMATQTPEDSNFISWWDFGYWYQTRGERATVSDGGQGPRHETAWWYTAPVDSWNDHLPFLRDTYKVTHIIQDYTLPGKYGAITAIATDGKGIVGLQQFNQGNSFAQGNTTIQEFTAGDFAIWVPTNKDGNLAGSPMLLSQQGGQYVQSGFINDVCTTQGILRVGEQTPSVGGCVSLSSFGVYYIPEIAKNNIFVSLQFMDGAGLPVEKVFDNGFLKIYKVNYGQSNAANSTAA